MASLRGNGSNVVMDTYGVCQHVGVMYRAGNFFFWIDLNVNSVNHRSTQGKQWKLSIIPSITPKKDSKQCKPCWTIF